MSKSDIRAEINALKRAINLTKAKHEIFRTPSLNRLREAVRIAGRTIQDDKQIFRLQKQLDSEIAAHKAALEELAALKAQLTDIGTKIKDAVRVELAPVANTIKAQQAEIDEATANAFRMAAEMARKLNLTQQEHRVFEALIETAGNELAAAQSLITHHGKTKKYTVKVKDPLTGAERKLRRTKGSGYSRANVQLIRERIEKKIGATGFTNPRTFWAKAHPLAHTVPDKPTGKKTGTMPAR